jgi:DNA invertase Pin-like site-specific DNA recombinase
MIEYKKSTDFIPPENTVRKLRLCAYIRVSDEKQTVENQRIAIENYVKAHPDWQIVELFKDEGISAFVERPDFNRMKEAISMNLFDAVIAYKLDRIGRSVIDLRNNIDFFKANKCDVIFVADHIDTSTPQGRLFFTIQSAFAEYEAEMIRERTRLGLARVRINGSKSGKPIGRPREKVSDSELLRLYNEGKGLQRVANEVGLTKGAVEYRMKKMGVKLRPNPFMQRNGSI